MSPAKVKNVLQFSKAHTVPAVVPAPNVSGSDTPSVLPRLLWKAVRASSCAGVYPMSSKWYSKMETPLAASVRCATPVVRPTEGQAMSLATMLGWLGAARRECIRCTWGDGASH